ncbi:Dipeptidyl aminopeptidase/acylaminoacyl peptidase [Sphingomonas guangdongensis]|uniref:Dipeptidyl aminopeptidase/acylaminoacyl peptidase n=1 Tax=Sphingomonas guangdongensis TaxID=1141890 RepID=A0A285R237_9SPHN|nr:S9 family peptidase [Sphingomonas guangdongensis]SOB88170.1 Dipeptidyl aminopeptidase/acylaminoacyl peptidase [Sphingomonas guangdongensis]
MIRRFAAAALLLAGTTHLSAQQATGPTRTFTGADLFALEMASDPQISPDGTTVAYVRRSGDVMSDTMRSSIWLVNVPSGKQTPLVASGTGSASQPRWSPDGTRLAYVASEGGSPQLYVRWIATGTTAKVTGLPTSPSALSWSPDGTRIAYTMLVADEAPKLGKAPPKPEDAKWAEPLEVIERVTYRADGDGYLKPGYNHIFVVSADGGAPRQLTFGQHHDDGPLGWTPDGRQILFGAVRTPDWEREPNNSEVLALNVTSGALTPLTKRYGPDFAPQVSPDGRQIAFLGSDDKRASYTVTQAYVMNRDGSGVRSLTANLDRDIDTLMWARDGRSLIVSYDDDGAKKVARLGLNGQLTTLAEKLAGGGLDRPYTGGSFSVSRAGTVAYTANDASRPADVYVAGKRLTRLNDEVLAAKTLAPVRELAVTAPDGRRVPAWLALPPNHQPGTRVPLILEIHGGPHTAYGPTFATDVQLYAAAGYAVLYTNPRGSTSYGSDFANLIDKKYPGDDYNDLMAAVDAAVASGVADPENLFVTGGSGGGVLTTWIVGKTNRFKAAAAQKPVINWISEALTMDSTGFTSRYWFAKQPWEDPMSYWSRSPLSLVGSINTPTLVVVGSEDYRTPVSESEQLYAALQIRGVPTALVKVTGASHGGFTARPSQSAAKASAILAWFDRYRNKPAAAPPVAE